MIALNCCNHWRRGNRSCVQWMSYILDGWMNLSYPNEKSCLWSGQTLLSPVIGRVILWLSHVISETYQLCSRNQVHLFICSRMFNWNVLCYSVFLGTWVNYCHPGVMIWFKTRRCFESEALMEVDFYCRTPFSWLCTLFMIFYICMCVSVQATVITSVVVF